MNSKNMPIIMVVSVICLFIFGGVFYYFGIDKYLSMFRTDSPPASAPGVVHVPPPIPPMEQTIYEVEIAIVEAEFAAKKAARSGGAGKRSPEIEYSDDPSRWDLKRRDKKSKTIKIE